MGHAILRKDLVRNIESASIPQFLNESFDDGFRLLHSQATSTPNPIVYRTVLLGEKSIALIGLVIERTNVVKLLI